MEKKKYWKNVIRGPFYFGGEPGTTGIEISAHNNEYGNGTTLGYHCINDYYEAPITHSHDFHELICFLGGDPENIDDLGAEIRICLGEEMEEHIINSATVISIPPGVPINCQERIRWLSCDLGGASCSLCRSSM